MVSIVIGGKGIQIKKLQEDSRTKIVVNQPIKGMSSRIVKI
jgi:hypothetical protein